MNIFIEEFDRRIAEDGMENHGYEVESSKGEIKELKKTCNENSTPPSDQIMIKSRCSMTMRLAKFQEIMDRIDHLSLPDSDAVDDMDINASINNIQSRGRKRKVEILKEDHGHLNKKKFIGKKTEKDDHIKLQVSTDVEVQITTNLESTNDISRSQMGSLNSLEL